MKHLSKLTWMLVFNAKPHSHKSDLKSVDLTESQSTSTFEFGNYQIVVTASSCNINSLIMKHTPSRMLANVTGGARFEGDKVIQSTTMNLSMAESDDVATIASCELK